MVLSKSCWQDKLRQQGLGKWDGSRALVRTWEKPQVSSLEMTTASCSMPRLRASCACSRVCPPPEPPDDGSKPASKPPTDPSTSSSAASAWAAPATQKKTTVITAIQSLHDSQTALLRASPWPCCCHAGTGPVTAKSNCCSMEHRHHWFSGLWLRTVDQT